MAGNGNRGLEAIPLVAAREAGAWAVGLNWHLNKSVKLVVDFERTTFAGGAVTGNRDPENAVLLRSRFAF